jgi:hypothetical protein
MTTETAGAIRNVISGHDYDTWILFLSHFNSWPRHVKDLSLFFFFLFFVETRRNLAARNFCGDQETFARA